MNQAYKGGRASSMRFSSRKPIFDSSTPAASATRREGLPENDELYRIVARIRELEDDVDMMAQQNIELEHHNHQLFRETQDLEQEGSIEDEEIERLHSAVQKAAGGTSFEQYEEELRGLAGTISHMHQTINQKQKQHGQLKREREALATAHLQLQQDYNSLEFEQNTLFQRVDELTASVEIGAVSAKDGGDSVEVQGNNKGKERNVEGIVEHCRALQLEITLKNVQLEAYKQEFQQQFQGDKSRRIQKEYNLRLLRERAQDIDKRKDLYRSCYNEERIEGVIDDMLEKEHLLREQIGKQLHQAQLFRDQKEQARENCEGGIAREREHLLQQLRLQRIQNDLAASQRQRGISDLHRLEQSMTDIKEEGADITIENKVADQQNFQRIGQLEKENVQLEGRYQDLLAAVDRLQYELRV